MLLPLDLGLSWEGTDSRAAVGSSLEGSSLKPLAAGTQGKPALAAVLSVSLSDVCGKICRKQNFKIKLLIRS